MKPVRILQHLSSAMGRPIWRGGCASAASSDGAAMHREAAPRLPRQQALAEHLYQRWLLHGHHLAM
ncbi:hypothetical protein CKO44_01200 [Rubrivivax gelatinosus]|uniref:Uncharacterized protein n=1 Tax=Rubrivivax gelatinosus TaxID=28068 RepID=A0ABS1DVL0_RUBGE|nr:hypothetical protein [Rubrivivax gelatinosus]MBK1612087.1 hypothetical protein [Rubrivivax gelatinosus]MBK1713161.1 hypothetical protein [Rubrivivax gelatinosus]